MAFEILNVSMYIWIALISLLFLIIVTALGGYGLDLGGDVDADVDVDMDYGEFGGPGISPLSLPLVAAFGTTFGAAGALLETTNLHPGIVAAGAALFAILVALALFLTVRRFLVRAQATSEVNQTQLVGRMAQVVIPIQRGSQGQILVITEERGRTLFPAQSDEEIGRDTPVEITGFVGGVASVRRKAA